MTRIKYQWYPSNELCKRFNVQNPFPGSALVGVLELQKHTSKISADTMDITILGSCGALGLPNTANELNARREMEEKKTLIQEKVIDSDILTWEDTDSQNYKVLYVTKLYAYKKIIFQLKTKNYAEEVDVNDNAPFELLQALFEESSSDNDSDSEDEEKPEIIAVKNIQTENQILLDNIVDQKDDVIIVEKIITVFDLVEDDDEYGPKLPPTLSLKNTDQIDLRNISSGPEGILQFDQRNKSSYNGKLVFLLSYFLYF